LKSKAAFFFSQRRIVIAVVTVLAVALACNRNPELQLDDIRSYQSSGRFAETIEPLRERLKEAPDDLELNHLYGLALLQTGEPSLAIWSLREAAQDPDRAVDDGILLVNAILAGGSAEDAAVAASRVLELAPENVAAVNLLIDARLRRSPRRHRSSARAEARRFGSTDLAPCRIAQSRPGR